jgi:hypothetical protein
VHNITYISDSFRDQSIITVLAEAQEHDEQLQGLKTEGKFTFVQLPIPLSEKILWYETTHGNRLYVPRPFRRLVFDKVHNLAHPGVRSMTKQITKNYFWPNMKRDTASWVKTCLQCQRSKIQRHTKTPIGTFSQPDARFSHVHLDIVGPLTHSNGKEYLLTMVDRFTRWPEAVAISDISAETCARAFIILLVGSAAPGTARSPDNSQRRPRSFTSRPGLRHSIAITRRHDPNQHARFHGQPSTNTPLCRGTEVEDERDPLYGFTNTRRAPSLPPERPAASQIRIRPSRRREEAITAPLRRPIQSVGKEP